MGLCDKAPACEVGHQHVTNASLDSVKNVIDSKDLHPQKVPGKSIEEYIGDGGYKFFKNVTKAKWTLIRLLKN